jgi:NAD(P)-dependent dehydrogenase (short-subunit alcohol dehydrogenase family)
VSTTLGQVDRPAGADRGPHAGRVALVAGGTGAIGREVVRQLAACGAAVAVHGGSRRQDAEALAAELPRAVVVTGDLTIPDEVDRVFAEVEGGLGPIDLLVNTVHPGPAGAVPVIDVADDFLDAHLDGVRVHLALCRRALPAMRRKHLGRIVFVSGALMSRPVAGLAAYGAAKSAASVLTRYLALEEGRNGITANVVAPGRVCERGAPEPADPAMRAASDALRARMALERFPTPADVAGVVVGLTLPHSDHVTGQTLYVAGGEPIA